MKNKSVSIIIVNYHVKEQLFACINSIYKTTKSKFEIIVIDNDEKKTINTELKRKYPGVKYVSNLNKGFAQGNNVGVRYASGEYLFFLNPDTIVYPGSVNSLVSYFEKNKNAGIVAPLLLNKDRKPYELQGFSELTPLKAVFALSFINRVFPNNSVSKKYWMGSSKKERVRKVDVVPGSAFMIKKDLFNKLGKFDENFFLYFEENDLCKRVKDNNLDVVMIPEARVFHEWGVSTEKSNLNVKEIFYQSLYYYLKKHYGMFQALLVSLFIKINLQILALLLIILLALFLRLFNIDKNMTFIGDQGWFYLSARDMVNEGKIPLVGIASSRPWLHQGPIWTYILAPSLLIGKFNPLSGAFLTAFLDILALGLLYKVGVEFFTKRVGMSFSLIYAVSPAVIFNARMPYHTSPIPLFILLLTYSVLRWTIGRDIRYFPLTLFSMSVLYNLHLSTVVLWLVILGLLVYGFINKEKWVVNLLNKKTIFLSFFCFITPMIPVLIYDINNGFRQTFWYAAWFVYKPLQGLGFFPGVLSEHTYRDVGFFFIDFFSRLVFSSNIIVSTVILIVAVAITFFSISRKLFSPIGIVFSFTSVTTFAYFASKTPSYAYLPMLFIGFIILVVFTLDKLLGKHKYVFFLLIIVISAFNIVNVFTRISEASNYQEVKKAAEKVIKIADGREYNLLGKGPGSEFESFTMSYKYLTWWLGEPPSESNTNLKIVVEEDGINPEVGVKIKNE